MPSASTWDRVLPLLDRPATTPEPPDGVLDLVGPAASDDRGAGGPAGDGGGSGSGGAPSRAPRPSLAQRAMRSRIVPVIYERAWRPLLFQAWTLRTTRAEERLQHELLAPRTGDVALDVACGPGNTTRRLRSTYDGGLVVGCDYSTTMLGRATADTDDDGVAYVRGDAHHLPFRDGTFDLVCCFGALYLVEDPFAVTAELLRVLRPGGRIAVLTTCERGPAPLRATTRAVLPVSGLRGFAPDAFTSRFRDAGLTDVTQVRSGWSQTVAGRRPAAG